METGKCVRERVKSIRVINESGTASNLPASCASRTRGVFYGEKHMFSFYHFMKHCFDFKGRASRAEFFFSIPSYLLFGGLLHICEALIYFFVLGFSAEFASRFSLVSLFGGISMCSLAVRRLRDAGYSERTLKWIAFPVGPCIAFFVSMIPNEISVK